MIMIGPFRLVAGGGELVGVPGVLAGGERGPHVVVGEAQVVVRVLSLVASRTVLSPCDGGEVGRVVHERADVDQGLVTTVVAVALHVKPFGLGAGWPVITTPES